jgi:hypothetical protein
VFQRFPADADPPASPAVAVLVDSPVVASGPTRPAFTFQRSSLRVQDFNPGLEITS